MSRIESPPRTVIALALSGMCVRLWLIWSGWCDQYLIADDAFYYFTIARNVALGLGATFDGLSSTNGFHPLYFLLLVPIFALTSTLGGDAWIPIHAGLTLTSVFDIATGYFLFRILDRLDLRKGAIWAAGIWYLSPFTVLLSLRGLEGSLSVFLFSVLFYLLLGKLGTPLPDRRQSAVLGTVFGLLVLTRTDLLLMLPVVVLMAGSGFRKTPGLHHREVLAAATSFAVMVSVLILPWIVWNVIEFGTVTQVSGLAKLENPRIFGSLAPGPDLHWAWAIVQRFGALILVPVRFVVGEESEPARWTIVVGAVIGIMYLLAALTLLRGRYHLSNRQRIAAIGVALYLAIHVVAYCVVLSSYVTWYASIPSAVFAAMLGVLTGEVWLRSRPARRAWPAVLLYSALFITLFWRFFDSHPPISKGRHTNLRDRLEQIELRYPHGASIGAYNAGALGYFVSQKEGYRVINLDGLTNNAAIDALRSNTYYDYVLAHVDVLWLGSVDELDIWFLPDEKERILQVYRVRENGLLFKQ